MEFTDLRELKDLISSSYKDLGLKANSSNADYYDNDLI